MPDTTPERGYEYPCYGDPSDFPTQMQTLATDIDTDVQQIVNDINNIGLARQSARMIRTAVLAVANNTQTPVVFDSAAQPPFWPGATSTITFPKTAAYLLMANTQWDIADTGQRRADLRRLTPSALSFAVDLRDGIAAAALPGFDNPVNTVTAMCKVTAGDTMQLRVLQTSGVALNLIAATFSIVELSQ